MANHLADEASPYLRQHRDQPVDWYPWGDEAFARARAEDKPVFLSVGYSSCHWCHVMAHESFDDPAIAARMNDAFVSVKVDREERPDVDAVYMEAVQAMTGRGGWPMSVFLTPDGRPFFGGTYWPSHDRAGMPGFVSVLDAVDDAWRHRRDGVVEQADRLREALSRSVVDRIRDATEPVDVTPALLDSAYQALRERFDPQWGGFGGAPKFPPSATLSFLARRVGDPRFPDADAMLRTTLDAMAAGGIHDHVGGGFARYSVDGWWLVPHFEKMLYDQAGLVRAYLHGHLATGEPRWRRVVERTIAYVLRDLLRPGGGFASAEDADSEGEEGRFYVWSRAEIEEVCGADAAEVVRYFGATDGGNFEGANVLHAVDRTEDLPDAVARAIPRLAERRAGRARPGLDDKVLLAWNALFLRALAEAADALDRPDWMEAARGNARFLLTSLRRDDGRLLRSWQSGAADRPGVGRARHLAYAEDHAALLEALLTLAEVDDPAWLDDARSVADALLALFHDPGGGGFYATGSDAEQLLVRPHDATDDATPSATSLAADGLLRLAALTGDDRYREPALAAVRLLAPAVAEHPTAFGYLLEAVERLVRDPLEVVVVGPREAPATRALHAEVARRLLPAAVSLTVTPEDVAASTSPLLAGRVLLDGAPTAYVCEGYACDLPVTAPEALRARLAELRGAAPLA